MQGMTRGRLRVSGAASLTLLERLRDRRPRMLRSRLTVAPGRNAPPELPRRRLSRPRLRSLFTIRGAAVLAGLVLCLGLGWLWFRSSSLVQIRQVSVSGLSGPGAKRIRTALTDAARSMTTLNLSVAKLDASVSEYPTVHSLSVRTQFPHGVTIAVDEQVPLAEVTVDGRVVIVDAAGQLLPDSRAPHGPLPNVPLRSAPTGGRITAPGAMSALTVLKAAPFRMLRHMQTATWSSRHGVIIHLRQGPELYFGTTGELAAKWTAALAVLADSASHGAQYIDVADPRRPAAGVQVAPPASTVVSPQTTTSSQATSSSGTGGAPIAAGG